MNIRILWTTLDLIELYYSGLSLRHTFAKFIKFSDSYFYYCKLSLLLTPQTSRDS